MLLPLHPLQKQLGNLRKYLQWATAALRSGAAERIVVKVVSKGKYWTVSILGPSSSPRHSVRKAVPGIAPADYYWTATNDGVTIAFSKLKDAGTFLKNGGALMVAIGYSE